MTEAYQNLRTALLFARKDEGGQVVLVTGTAPQEGKTTTLVNIAKLLAASGEKTHRHRLRPAPRPAPHLARPRPRARASPTTSCSHVDLDTLIRTTHGAQPVRAHRGRAAAQPARPPRPPRHGRAARRACARHFEWVLIDSPPLASVTDALLLARHADIVLFVVQHNKVDKKL